MFLRDIMTTNVVTIPSNTSIIGAKRIMDSHGFKRLPVVDKGKLVGVITRRSLENAIPLQEIPGDIWEISYSLVSIYRTPVRRIMRRDMVTATPDMTVEEAVALAQAKKVGALVVVENGQVVGIATTNDFFYRIVNPVLGVGEPGERIWVAGGGEGKAMEEIISIINKHGLNITTLHIIAAPKATKKDIVVHLHCDDVRQLVAELKAKGYKVGSRKR